MELRQLKYFLAIADSGSFSAAAERVFVAQSALSHQMAQLEGELGVALFLRTRRGVALTEAGQRFYPHAVSILRQTDEAAQAARSGGGTPSGKVVFGLPHSVSSALALPLLRAVRQALPQVQLELTEELTGNLTPQLRAGQIQLAVLFDDGTLSEFSWTPMLRERLCLIGPPQGTARRAASVTLRRALAQPLILPAQPHGVGGGG
ncbi:LysR family transcriptional regulator, partial [Hydrogenophaga sp.]|uniref:LysR family transcriptional regulator n=1 Tax=Hydrogenophaga sp. TaxID=1904254 RepID=UPI00286D75A1